MPDTKKDLKNPDNQTIKESISQFSFEVGVRLVFEAILRFFGWIISRIVSFFSSS